jgi:uncharacterized membrane protein YjdF
MQHSACSVWRKLYILTVLSITEHWQLTEWHLARVVGEACCADQGTRGSSTALLLTDVEIREIGALTVGKFVQLLVINIRTLCECMSNYVNW